MTEQKCFVFRFADVEVREREFRVMRAGAVLPVEPKAFRVLLYLLRNPNKLIPKDELLDAIWGTTAVTENSLTRAVALLRRVLEDDTREPHFIATVATVGYRFVCPVELVEESSGESEPKTQPIGNDDGEAPATPVSPIVVPVASAKTKVRARRGLWLTLGSASVAVGLAVGFAFTYFLTRPEPAPKVSNYVQLTRDGKQKQPGRGGGFKDLPIHFRLRLPGFGRAVHRRR